MATCAGCDAAIVWARTPAGKRIPLDATPEQRVVLNDDRGHLLANRAEIRNVLDAAIVPAAQFVQAFMPHHATCPEVERFRR